MDLNFSSDEEAFRAEVRAFLADELPDGIRAAMDFGRSPDPEAMRRWTQILHARGWSTPGWPAEHGGPGWSPIQRYIFGEELQMAPAPAPLPFGVNMVGPVIYTFGDAAQKARFLPRIATLEDWWCQGFSEPGAGSDLASLRTAARRDGDDYVIDGQKIWTSFAQHADWIFLLVRTDPDAKKQAGISFLLVDMKTPGITARPIVTLDGGDDVNEVFFDAVRVPAANRIGEENKGWDYAKFLLGHERLSIARVGTSKHRLRRLRVLAADRLPGDARFAEKLTALEIELKALEITEQRLLAAGQGAGAQSSMLKIRGSEIQQATTELMMELAGPEAARFDPGLDAWTALAAPTYFNWRKLSIYGGSNEIQRTIVAKSILGL